MRASLQERDSPVTWDFSLAYIQDCPVPCLSSCCWFNSVPSESGDSAVPDFTAEWCLQLSLQPLPSEALLHLSKQSALAEAQAGAGKPAPLPPHSYPKAASGQPPATSPTGKVPSSFQLVSLTLKLQRAVKAQTELALATPLSVGREPQDLTDTLYLPQGKKLRQG